MSVIINPTKISEALWKSAISLTIPSTSLKLQPDQFFDDALLVSLKDGAARLNMTIEIDSELTDAAKYVRALRMQIIRKERIIRDGSTLLIPESYIPEFIEEVTRAQEEGLALFSQFSPTRVIDIRDGMLERVTNAIAAALTNSKSHNLTDARVQEVAENSANLFVNTSFPDISAFTEFAIDYDYPTPAIQPMPGLLDEAAVKVLREKQRGEVGRLWQLLFGQYTQIESLVASGGLHLLDTGVEFEYVDSEIIRKIEENRATLAKNRELKRSGADPKALPHDVPCIFGQKMAKVLGRDSENLGKAIIGMSDSLDDLATSDDLMAGAYKAISSNLKLVPAMIATWQQEALSKKTKCALTVTPQQLDIDGDDDALLVAPEPLKVKMVEQVVIDTDDDDSESILSDSEPTVVAPVASVFADDDCDTILDEMAEVVIEPEIYPSEGGTKSKARTKKPVARKPAA
jgi:hypothetical protein